MALVVWNLSRKLTTMEVCISNLTKEHDIDISRIEKSHVEDIKKVELQIAGAKVERKEEIAKALLNQKDELATIQRQIDGTKSDVKDQSSRVTSLVQKGEYADNAVKRLEVRIDDEKLFFAKWNQRVEDRVENLRDEFIGMFKAFHSHGNGNKDNHANDS